MSVTVEAWSNIIKTEVQKKIKHPSPGFRLIRPLSTSCIAIPVPQSDPGPWPQLDRQR